MRACSAILIAVIPLAWAACATPRAATPSSLHVARAWKREGLHIMRETPHFVYWHAPATEISQNDLEIAERHLTRVARRLSIRPPRRLLYLVASEGRMLELAGSTGAAESLSLPGLAHVAGAEEIRSRFDGIILSASPRSLHEITHCVSALVIESQDFLYRSPLIFEGLAVAWSLPGSDRLHEQARRARASGCDLMPGDLVSSFPHETNAVAEDAYWIAGSFVTHLIEKYGLKKLVRLLRRGRKDRFPQEFRATYERPFEEVEAEWLERIGASSTTTASAARFTSTVPKSR